MTRPTPTSLQEGLGARAMPSTTPAAPETARLVRDVPPEEPSEGEEGAAETRGRRRRKDRAMVTVALRNWRDCLKYSQSLDKQDLSGVSIVQI